MKHLKIPGLAVMAAAALMAFASSASAVVLTSAGTDYTGTLKMSATHSVLLEGSFLDETCTGSVLEVNLTTNTTVASGAIKSLTLDNCDATAHVTEIGSVEVKSGGEVRTVGTKLTFEDAGISCIYGGGTGVKLGTLSGGTTAFFNLSATLQKQGGSFLCPSTNKWTGQYTVTTPDTLLVD